MTVEEKEATHVILMTREPHFPYYARIDTDATGRRFLRLILRSVSALAAMLLVAARLSAQPVVINHTSLPGFAALSDQTIATVAGKRVLYIDRSVGDTIRTGLSCLAAASDETAASICRRNHSVAAYQSPASEFDWSHVGGYPNTNIRYLLWPNIGCPNNGWALIYSCILNYLSLHASEFDVALVNLSYMEIEGADIVSQVSGFFAPQPDKFDVSDIEAWIDTHPDKQWIWLTPSLSRASGQNAAVHLQQWRDYMAARASGVFLDLADIESNDPWGNPCQDNRDGVLYEVRNASGVVTSWENWPNDNVASPALCQDYTIETDGGHLGNPAAGMIRAAKAFWLALAALDAPVYLPDVTPPNAAQHCANFDPENPRTQAEFTIDINDDRGVGSLTTNSDGTITIRDVSGNAVTLPAPHCP